MNTDFLIRQYVYAKQEAAIARNALEMACAKTGLSMDELLEIASYQEQELIEAMQQIEKEAIADAARVTGITPNS